MNQNQLSFESENLLVDWIGFNIQGLIDRKQVKQIANYLFRTFGFNSTIIIQFHYYKKDQRQMEIRILEL